MVSNMGVFLTVFLSRNLGKNLINLDTVNNIGMFLTMFLSGTWGKNFSLSLFVSHLDTVNSIGVLPTVFLSGTFVSKELLSPTSFT